MAKRKFGEDADQLDKGDIVQLVNVDHVLFKSYAKAYGAKMGITRTIGPESLKKKVFGVGVVKGFFQEKGSSENFVAVESKGGETFFVDKAGLEKIHLKSSPQLPVAIMQKLWESRDTTGDAVLDGTGAEGSTTKICFAHACVLGTASPVFAASFTIGMNETRTREVQIKGVSSQIIEDVLECIYTGKKVSPSNIVGCLHFAHKYMMIDLAKQLVTEAIQSVNVGNASQLARLLKDFDTMQGSDTHFVDAIMDAWGNNKEVMKSIIRSL